MSNKHKNKKRNISIEIQKFKNGVYNIGIWEIVNHNMSHTRFINHYKDIHKKKFKKLFRKYRSRILRVKYEYTNLDYF